jgi:nucleotide-binding universal stress UspA family protein
VTLIGLAVDDILEQAAKYKADYIILGSHGHGALYHLFSGSVVTGILKRAKCPIIVVPSTSTSET